MGAALGALAIAGTVALALGQRELEAVASSDEFTDVLLERLRRSGLGLSPTQLREEMKCACTCSTPTNFEVVQALHKQTRSFTGHLLEKMPGDIADASILPHVLVSIAGDHPVSFGRYGGQFGAGPLSDLHALQQEHDSGWELTLTSPPRWCDADSMSSLSQNEEVKQAFVANATRRIATSLSVTEAQVHITAIREGSVIVAFTVADLTLPEKERILSEDVTGKLRGQFDTFSKLRISPVVLALHFDLDQLDARGNKVFPSGETHQVGPSGNQRNYHQPTGWTRFGFKVLGRYENDTWLHPFQHQNNWYRAFHATGRAAVGGAAAARAIVATGFRESRGGTFGPGVYVSPFVTYCENGYADVVAVETSKGRKNFKYVLQVAVRPGSIMQEGYPSNGENQEWTAPAAAVRPYGLLIKEV